jgi:FHS family L-fucose permease-like MFS transporter
MNLAQTPAFPLFLAALVVLAAGMTTVQVAANPYVTLLARKRPLRSD